MLRALGHLFLLLFCVSMSGADNPSPGRGAVTLVEVRGTVTIQRGNATTTAPAKVGDVLRVGDTIRTGEDSWVAVRLSDLSVIRKGPRTTITIQPPVSGGEPVLDIKAGLLYFFGRDRTDPARVRVPTAAGAIRGTDFSLEVLENGESLITMIDGAVDLTGNGGETATLTNGMQARVDASGKLAATEVSPEEVRRVIQWALYYPAVLDLRDLKWGTFSNHEIHETSEREPEALRESVAAYRSGDLKKALEVLPKDFQPSAEKERIYYAAVLIGNGSLEKGLKFADGTPALKRLVEGIRSAGMGNLGGVTPMTATEFLVESYVAQGQGKLNEALANAGAAARLNEDFGFAWVRVAELEFSFGHTDAASVALEKALKLTPDFAPAHVLMGFTLAARWKWAEAEASFNRALELDGAIGNAWLGRGLVKMRRGERVAGRDDLQTASLMEPQRAILRSYLGKAHFETKNSTNALRELELAIRLEPGDPTAWLYLAILEHQENRLNEGIADLEKSKELNKNRAVFRSQLLLDQDQAVRAANLAAIYRDAGLQEVSVREAARAVNYDYGNGSAHLFLANSYDALRDPSQVNLRYETAWLNELLLANLLTPVGAGSLSQAVSQQEYSPLFARDGVGFSSGTRYLSSGDWQQYASLHGTVGGMSYSLDGVYYSKNSEPNRDVEHKDFFGKVKQRLTAKDTLFFEVIYYDYESGDASPRYDPNTARRTFRFNESQEPTVFAGYHREWSPEHQTLFLLAALNDEVRFSQTNISVLVRQIDPVTGAVGGGFDIEPFGQRYQSEFTIWSAEAQHIWTPANHQFIAGGRVQHGNIDTVSGLFRDDATMFPTLSMTNGVQANRTELTRGNLYGYWHWQVLEPLRLIAGLSYDYLDYPANIDYAPITDAQRTEERVSPKAGFLWNPTPATWMRGLYSRSLGGLYFDNSARLEPAQLAGFMQGFRSGVPESEMGSLAGADFETFALGLEHRFTTRTYIGVDGEFLYSNGGRSYGVLDYPGPPAMPNQDWQELKFQEKSFSGTLHQLIGDEFSFGATYRISHAQLNQRFPYLPGYAPDVRLEGTLKELRLFTIWNHERGFFAQVDGVWRHQRNQGYADRPGDSFWQGNAWVGYRLPRHRAEFRLGILNIFDQDYRLSPLNLHSAPPRDRTLAVELKLNF